MKKINLKSPALIISALGLVALSALYIIWAVRSDEPLYSKAAAFFSAALFAFMCLRFVPGWVKQWSGESVESHRSIESDPQHILLIIFLTFIAYDAFILLCAALIRLLAGDGGGMNYWLRLDSRHYLDIARDWYLSQGSIDRLVQLAFLPGYPLAVRLFSLVTGEYLYAGMLVSALCFALMGCAAYKLLRLDMGVRAALRGLKYLCILPGAFFYAAPMSESLFALTCVLCIYFTRREKWLLSCAFGAIAAFTRSLGLALVVPVLFEMISALAAKKKAGEKYSSVKMLFLCLIPLGFGAYCLVNYTVSGDPFKFMQYQSEHWSQHLGLFFNTAAYQTRYAIESIKSAPENLWGLWLPNLVCAFGALIIIAAGAKRIRPGYTVWFIAYYVIAIGATWLLSAPRYMLVIFPLPLALATVTERKAVDAAVTALISAFSLFYLYAFCMEWQVW